MIVRGHGGSVDRAAAESTVVVIDLAKADDRGPGATTFRRRVAEADDQRMPGQQRLDDGALHPDSPPVDQPDFAEPALVGGPEVLLDDRRNVARGEGVEVERVLDGDADGLVVGDQRRPEVAGRFRGAGRPSRAPASAGSSGDPPPRACTVRTSRPARRTRRRPAPRSRRAPSRRPSGSPSGARTGSGCVRACARPLRCSGCASPGGPDRR